MAVPKRKTSNSRRGMRRSHQGLKPGQQSVCPQCGAIKPQHHICPACGYYRGSVVLSSSAGDDGEQEEK